MSPTLTLLIPTTKSPPGAWWAAEAVLEQAIAANAEVLVAVGHAVAEPGPPAPCRVLHMPGADVFDLRAAALADARGDIVVLLEDHNYPAPDFCARILEAFAEHPQADGVVGSATNGALGLVDRASFLLTWAPFIPPVTEIDFDRCPPPGIVAFRRSVVPDGVPKSGWLEYEMVVGLRDKGLLVADERVQMNHIQNLRRMDALTIHFHSGRAYGGLDTDSRAKFSRLRRFGRTFTIPFVLFRQTRAGLRRGKNYESFACMTIVGALAVSNAIGQMVGVLFGAGNSASHLE